MRITIEFNGMGEIHALHEQSAVEMRIVKAAVRKLPREINKVEMEIDRLRQYTYTLQHMHKQLEDMAQEDVVNYLTR